MDNTQVLRSLYNCLRNPSGRVTTSATEVWASGYKRSLKAVKVTKRNDHYVSVGAPFARHNHRILQVHVQKAIPLWCWMGQVFLTWKQGVKLMRWTEEDVIYLINIIQKVANHCFQKWGMYQVCFSASLRYLYPKWCLNILNWSDSIQKVIIYDEINRN